jgi:hypothetical protein
MENAMELSSSGSKENIIQTEGITMEIKIKSMTQLIRTSANGKTRKDKPREMNSYLQQVLGGSFGCYSIKMILPVSACSQTSLTLWQVNVPFLDSSQFIDHSSNMAVKLLEFPNLKRKGSSMLPVLGVELLVDQSLIQNLGTSRCSFWEDLIIIG